MMFNFDLIDLQRIAVAAVGALILTTTAVTAAVGPARVVETTPIAYVPAAYAQAVAEEARA